MSPTLQEAIAALKGALRKGETSVKAIKK